jgi:hypothetical protein
VEKINIILRDNKTVKVNNDNIISKYDNFIAELVFNFDECIVDEKLQYKYFVIKNEEDEEYKIIDITNRDSLVIDYNFSLKYGKNECIIVLSENNKDNFVLNDKDNFVSNIFYLNITNNFLTGIHNLEIINDKEVM